MRNTTIFTTVVALILAGGDHGEPLLFRIADDPAEEHNLAAQYPEVVPDLSARVKAIADLRQARPRGGQRQRRQPASGEDDRDRRRDRRQNPDQARRRSRVTAVFNTEVPDQTFDIILGRPTGSSVTASVLAYQDMEGYLEYGTDKGAYPNKTAVSEFNKGEPADVVLDSLQPDTRYYYRLRYRRPGSSSFTEAEESTFHTQRSPGATFTFTVQADSHLDRNASPEVYKLTLANALAAQPDFHIDLGDTFMTDQRRTDFREALPQYLAQRYYFGLISHSAPLFLVLGNHDGEGGYRHDGTATSMAAWSISQRKRYFPNPRPDGFYSGNTARDPVAGLLENYYAWEWGDGLFIVADPFWPTTRRGGDGNWRKTLGQQQYSWLNNTLEESRALFKFVFIHYLVGGKDHSSRGGVAAARYFEWGGHNPDGSYGFTENRPGWEAPIHQLLVENNVAVVFHGHDHLFAKEELDGVIYQLVPHPGSPRFDNTRSAAEYGYVHGDVLGSSGYIGVTLSANEAKVDYVRTYLPADEREGRGNGQVGYSYAIGK